MASIARAVGSLGCQCAVSAGSKDWFVKTFRQFARNSLKLNFVVQGLWILVQELGVGDLSLHHKLRTC